MCPHCRAFVDASELMGACVPSRLNNEGDPGSLKPENGRDTVANFCTIGWLTSFVGVTTEIAPGISLHSSPPFGGGG